MGDDVRPFAKVSLRKAPFGVPTKLYVFSVSPHLTLEGVSNPTKL